MKTIYRFVFVINSRLVYTDEWVWNLKPWSLNNKHEGYNQGRRDRGYRTDSCQWVQTFLGAQKYLELQKFLGPWGPQLFRVPIFGPLNYFLFPNSAFSYDNIVKITDLYSVQCVIGIICQIMLDIKKGIYIYFKLVVCLLVSLVVWSLKVSYCTIIIKGDLAINIYQLTTYN